MSFWIEFLTVLVEVILPAYFFASFFGRPPCRGWIAVLGAAGYGVLLFLLSWYLDASLIRSALIIALTYLCVKLLFDRPWLQALLPVVFFFTASILADILCGVILRSAGATTDELMGGTAMRAVYNSIGKLMHLLFLYVFLRFFGRQYEKNTLVRCLPLISCIVVSALICYFNYALWMGENALTASLSGSIGLLYINILICVYVELLDRSYTRQREDALARQQLEAREVTLRDISARQEKARALRHDIQKHLAAMEVLIGQENRAEAQRNLDLVSSALSEMTPPVDTGNALVDSILIYGFDKAAAAGVEILPEIWVAERFAFPAVDFFVILGNTLDNAVEACAGTEGARVELTLRQQNHTLIYEIRNPRGEKRRKHGEARGYGLRNGRAAVERNGGTMDGTEKDGTFSVHIRLSV